MIEGMGLPHTKHASGTSRNVVKAGVWAMSVNVNAAFLVVLTDHKTAKFWVEMCIVLVETAAALNICFTPKVLNHNGKEGCGVRWEAAGVLRCCEAYRTGCSVAVTEV